MKKIWELISIHIILIIVMFISKIILVSTIDNANGYIVRYVLLFVLLAVFVLLNFLIKRICIQENVFIEKNDYDISKEEKTASKLIAIAILIIAYLIYYAMRNLQIFHMNDNIILLLIPLVTLYYCSIAFIESPYKVNTKYKNRLLVEYCFLFIIVIIMLAI